MRITILNRMVLVAAILSMSLVGTNMPANAQERQQQDPKGQDKKQQQNQNKQQRAQQQQQDQNKQQQQRAQQRQQDQNKQQKQRAQQRQQDQNKQQQQRAQQQWQRDQNKQQQQRAQQQWQRDQSWPQRVQQQRQQDQNQVQERRSQQQRQQLITEQQQRLTQYSQYLDQRQRVGQQQIAELQRQGRMAGYRYQQDYIGHLHDQDLRLRNGRHDYDNDPYFYTGWNYRYYRNGRYYETNQYGANLLRDAINYGYEQGYLAGRADRQDGWQFNYQNSYAYEDANYGYDGYYVPRDEYNYYFRQGFRRGYEDGYYSRYRYGSYSSGKYTILGALLGSIIDMQSLH
jgi:hypothetical protein